MKFYINTTLKRLDEILLSLDDSPGFWCYPCAPRFKNRAALMAEVLEKASILNFVSTDTPEDVQVITEKYIDPEKMTIVLVGDEEALVDQLKEFQQSLKQH